MDDRIAESGSAGTLTVPSREEMIAVAAYYRAEQRGFAAGDPQADWLAAAAQIDALLATGSSEQQAAVKPKSSKRKRVDK